MLELWREDFSKILNLYQLESSLFPLILSVIRRVQRGWVFVDQLDNPGSAMVITGFGFTQIFGADRHAFDSAVEELFRKWKVSLPSYLLWYSPPPRWQSRLDVFVPKRIKRRERIRFHLNEQLAEYLAKPADSPTGFDIKPLDEDLLLKTNELKLDLGSRYWASTDDFMKNGLGVCLLKNGEIVSLCYSACVVDGLAEVDIVTREEYQGQGLATISAQHFIRDCLQKNIQPTWDCFGSNYASIKLAERLGFTRAGSYQFYSFGVPFDPKQVGY
jgi:RimJ/RimL family protein N-acetyltransferase